MMTLSPAAPAAAPDDFCLFAHLKPHAILQALTKGEAIVWVLSLSLVMRLFLANFMPFTADEAYAVVVSRSHALSYYDHPPLMFAIARLMADIFGSETPLIMRLPFVLMGTASTAFIYDITRQCFGARAGLWASTAFCLSPFFLTFGQLLIVPDGPLDLCLLVCFWAILPIVKDGKSSLAGWSLAGAALGLALLSKYQAVLFGVGALVALASHRSGRRQFSTPGFWIALSLATLCLTPVLVWNARHGWISFAFQTGRAYHPTGLITHAGNVASVLLGQALYLLPVTWIAAQRAIWRGLWHPHLPVARWLAIIALIPVLTFDAIALIGHHSLPHWAMSGFLFALPLIGHLRSGAEGKDLERLRHRFQLAACLVPALAIGICLQSQTAFLTRYLFSEAPAFDLGWQNLDWSRARPFLPDDDSFILASDWVEAGHLGLAFGPAHPITVLSDPHQFQFIDQLRLKRRKTGYFVTATRLGEAPKALKQLMMSAGGRYRLAGPPRVRTQDRLGFPSFQLVILPVEKVS